jgi:mRNA-binding protein PUF3
MAAKQNISLLGQSFPSIAPRNRSEERPANTANLGRGIGNGITGDSNIWAHSASATRDSSRTRDVNQYLGASRDGVDGRQGSGSLVASSEADPPRRNTHAWGEGPALHMRSGVSPARRGSSQLPQSSSVLDGLQSFPHLPSQPRGSMSGTMGPRPANGSMNSTVGLTGRGLSETVNGLGPFRRTSDESEALSTWADSASVHSPTDDRRTNGQSEYFGTASSVALSRNSSLPGSRQSNEPASTADGFFTFGNLTHPRSSHNPSYSSQSSGRMFSERQPSQSSDLAEAFGDLRFDSDAERSAMVARSLLNQSVSFQLQTSSDVGVQQHLRALQMYQNLNAGSLNGGSFTPDGLPTGLMEGAAPALSGPRARQRTGLTPNGTGYRHASYVSAGGTPPGYESTFGRNEQMRTQISPPALNSRLQRLQQEQQFNANPYAPQIGSQFRSPYTPYSNPHAIPNGLLAPNMPINPAIPPFLSPGGLPNMPPPPIPNNTKSILSAVLNDYRSNNNKGRRWELKVSLSRSCSFGSMADQHFHRISGVTSSNSPVINTDLGSFS